MATYSLSRGYGLMNQSIIDATRLDAFSFDRFQSLLHRAQQDDKLARRLRAPGTVFFLHLLGLDTTGHGFGPHSKASSAPASMS
jgi:hypothetical protein